MILFIQALLLLFPVVTSTTPPCSSNTTLTSKVGNYASATQTFSSDEPAILAFYQNMTSIGDYSLLLGTPYPIYPNSNPTCSKDSTASLAFNAQKDIWICFDSFYTLSCNQIWELSIECGSFIEVHRPFEEAILASVSLGETTWVTDSIGAQLANVRVNSLCAGTYHLWFVYKSRIGKIVKGIRAFYISYPSCSC